MKTYLIYAAMVMLLASFSSAQTLFPFSIGGMGIATNISQCPPPAPNYGGVCPVIGQGWFYTLNGAAYASWVGPQGPIGSTPSFSIGNVTSGTSPQVTITGTQTNPILNFVLQPGTAGTNGTNGQNGQSPVLSVGTVSSGPSPQVTMTGTPLNPILNFVLQPGPQGNPGIAKGCTFSIAWTKGSGTGTIQGNGTLVAMITNVSCP